MSDQISQVPGDDDLSVEELEHVAGGSEVIAIDDNDGPNTNCGGNCHCGS